MKKALSPFRLVLVGTRTPGNVGACARVAANFACRDWIIADAKCAWDDWDARKFATGAARDYLDGARAVSTVEEAVQDCQIAIGFTRRQGKQRKPTIELGEIAALASTARVALVFGNEETGLSGDELAACTRLCTLPTSEEAPSMNLSHAVAVVLGRIYSDSRAVTRRNPKGAERVSTPARVAELEGMMKHWEEYLADIGMTTAGNPERMVASLRAVFARADLTPREVRALRGFISKAQVKLGVRVRGRRVAKS